MIQTRVLMTSLFDDVNGMLFSEWLIQLPKVVPCHWCRFLRIQSHCPILSHWSLRDSVSLELTTTTLHSPPQEICLFSLVQVLKEQILEQNLFIPVHERTYGNAFFNFYKTRLSYKIAVSSCNSSQFRPRQSHKRRIEILESCSFLIYICNTVYKNQFVSSQLRPWESHKRQIESLESCSFLSKHCLQYPFVPVSKCSNKWTINCLKKDFLNVPSSCSHSRSREEPSAWDRSLESVVVCPELLELCPSPEIQNTQQLKHFIISPVVIWIFLPITKQLNHTRLHHEQWWNSCW